MAPYEVTYIMVIFISYDPGDHECMRSIKYVDISANIFLPYLCIEKKYLQPIH